MENKTFPQKLSFGLYRIIRQTVRLIYPKIELKGLENLPEEPCMLVGNHSKMNGPIIGELYIPGKHRTWCTGEMMKLREVPDYAFNDFWINKSRSIRWFYRLLSYAIAPLSVLVFNNADTIAVYRDARIVSTFRQSAEALSEGAKLTVFPEGPEKHNHIVNQFQDGFVDVARLYYKKSGKALPFVPIYIAPALKTVYIGKAIYYEPKAEKSMERQRIVTALMDSISDMALALPRHRVVPYSNIPKKNYPFNVSPEVITQNESSPC